VSGRISLGRFTQLVDLVNHNRDFLVLHDARLLDREGRPTELSLGELVVAQDDVTFIGHGPDPAARAGPGDGIERSRHFAIFTPGHVITGGLHLIRDTTLANFVEATDPRFFGLSEAVVSSIEGRGSVSRFDLLLVNRTQISAIAETEHRSERIAAAASLGEADSAAGAAGGDVASRPAPASAPGAES
jgi:hypothetical protein